MDGTARIQLQADDYMDTVTVYRCKFCSFISTSTEGIKNHVSQVHIRPQQSVSVPATTPQVSKVTNPRIPTSSIVAVAAMATGATQPMQHVTSSHVNQLIGQNSQGTTASIGNNKYLTILPISNQMIPLQLENQQTQVHVLSDNSQGTEGPIIEMVENSEVIGGMDMGIQTDKQPESPSQGPEDDGSQAETIQVIMDPESVGLDDDNSTHVQVIHASGPLVMEEGQQMTETESMTFIGGAEKTLAVEKGVQLEEVHLVDQSSKGEVTEEEDSDIHSIEICTEPANSSQYDQYTFSTSNMGDQENSQANSESAVTTKELFLCGQCSIGFNSIQDCKDHMISEHGQPAQERGESSSGVTGQVSKVDVSTQVDNKKRPGRKKKSEIVVEEKPPVTMSDSDEDWTESLHVDIPNGRCRRRRRPPKSLKNDYYLGKSKRKVRKKTEGYIVKCTIQGCMAKFKSEETMQEHVKCHIPNASPKEPGFSCLQEDCREKFWFWKQSRYHMWKAHQIDMDLLTCPQCNVFKTDTMSKLRIHMEIHGSERPYTCDVCGKGFKQFAQMKNHQISHSSQNPDEPDRWYTSKTCDVCERTFANGKCLKKHKETVHSKIKPFQCTFCDHACSRKAMLLLHLRTHTNEKPFKCDTCSYVTGDHNSLRRHKMRHTGQKPYKCPHCPYACIQAISLKVHIKNKHPGQDGVYNCALCLFRTINQQQFINHQLDHKNNMIDMENVYPNPRPISSKVRKIKVKQEPVAVDVQEGTQVEMAEVEMQVRNSETTEGGTVINADDIAKLSNYEGLVPADITAAQLIYSALNAISQNAQPNSSQSSSEADTEVKDGVTTHTITFHVPASETEAESLNATNQQMILQPVEVIAMEDVIDGTVQICHAEEKTEEEDVQDTTAYSEIIHSDYEEAEPIVIQQATG